MQNADKDEERGQPASIGRTTGEVHGSGAGAGGGNPGEDYDSDAAAADGDEPGKGGGKRAPRDRHGKNYA